MLQDIARRRTFAIISHPDAGKTTLTEKLLLYGGAVQLAGSVTARKNQRAATSDWMELERKRGISVSSTVLQFDYHGYRVNLLDTPGHNDFSEDTYRVLTAVDSVVMVIDAGKGVESQTRKLFDVCRRRGVPIFTFVNKMDRPARDPLELLDELESVLGIRTHAANWPLGAGPEFAGVLDRAARELHLFEATPGGARRAPVSVSSVTDPAVRAHVAPAALDAAAEALALLDAAAAPFDHAAVLRGELTPVFFGSARNNFGVQLFLDAFLQQSPPPRARVAANGDTIEPDSAPFSGFVFKMQANMDPKHRDCIAFVRICSGRFERGMSVLHQQSGGRVRLASSHKLFGSERETVDEGYAGDVIGIVGHAGFRIGDTLTEDPAIVYGEIPRFAPEVFAYLHPTDTSQQKRFRSGLEQLVQEGAVQLLRLEGGSGVPLLGAVGALQLDVVQYRLQAEYGAGSRLEHAPWERLRWLDPGHDAEAVRRAIPSRAVMATDAEGRRTILFASDWDVGYFASRNPEIGFSDMPPQALSVPSAR